MNDATVTTTVEIVVLPDPYTDASYLAQPENEDRRAAYQRDEFSFVGIRARVRRHNWRTGVVSVVESAGLWGVESDSGEDYFRAVGEEELASITGDVATAGIDIFAIKPRLVVLA